jgi:hypothetical protein
VALNPKKFSAVCAGLALLVASPLELWTANSGFGLLSFYGSATLWELLASLPVELHFRFDPPVGTAWAHNARVTAVILIAGAALGRLFYWLKWERGSATS